MSSSPYTSTLQLWGEAYQLDVKYATASGSTIATITSNAWEPEALRITFDVQQRMVDSPWWSADINIYNLNLQTIQNTLFNATWATLKAGFQIGPNLYSTIWDGPVFQVLYDQEDVVDRRVTLRCIANPIVFDEIVSFATGPYSSQLQFVNKMAQQIELPQFSNARNGTLGPVAQQKLNAKQYPRGNTAFGSAPKYLSQIADDQFLQKWQDGYKAYISEVNKTDYTPQLIYCPRNSPDASQGSIPAGWTSSITGTPRQTPFGVIFTVLLDPRLKVQIPPLVVQLQRTLITQLSVTPTPNSGAFSPYANNLSFLVAQVRHTGDSRGNDWSTEVIGYSTTYADNLINGVFAANSMS